MSITTIDHAKEMLDATRSSLKRKPIHEAVLTIIGDEIQLAEDLMIDMYNNTALDDAEGDLLDKYGRIARVNRLDRTDDEYLRVIKIAGRANDSDGGIDDVLYVASGLVGEPVRYQFLSGGNFQLTYETSTPLDAVFVAEALELITRAVSGGVSWVLIEVSDIGEGKDFDGGPDGQGFEDYRFARIIGGSNV